MLAIGEITTEDYNAVMGIKPVADTVGKANKRRRRANTSFDYDDTAGGANAAANVEDEGAQEQTEADSDAAAEDELIVGERLTKLRTPLKPGNTPRWEYLTMVTRDKDGNLVQHFYRDKTSVSIADWRSPEFCQAVNRWSQQRSRRAGRKAHAPIMPYSQAEINWLMQRSRDEPKQSWPAVAAQFSMEMAGQVVGGVIVPERTSVGISAFALRNPAICALRGLKPRKKPVAFRAPKTAQGGVKPPSKVILRTKRAAPADEEEQGVENGPSDTEEEYIEAQEEDNLEESAAAEEPPAKRRRRN